jgi:fructose-1,6-bisphosphatase/inositol monophosphatase family enzyme
MDSLNSERLLITSRTTNMRLKPLKAIEARTKSQQIQTSTSLPARLGISPTSRLDPRQMSSCVLPELGWALLCAGLETVSFVRTAAEYDPVYPVTVNGSCCQNIDLAAASFFRYVLRLTIGGRFPSPLVQDEESLKSGPAKSTDSPIVVNLDPVDGTSNLCRIGSWWCVAATAFLPAMSPSQRIVASVVAFPDATALLWVRGYGRPWYIAGGVWRPVRGTSRRTTLENAGIAYVGQSIQANTVGSRLMEKLGGKTQKIWNVAGIPAILRTIDLAQRDRGLDVIVQLDPGQRPHDALPLLLLAGEAGAKVIRLDGRIVTHIDLEDLLLKPVEARISYVVAASDCLARKVLAIINDDTGLQVAA